MENQYGIAIKNRFLTMVDIDDDPIDYLKQQEAAKTKKEKAHKSKQSGKKAAVQSETKVKEQNVQKKEEKERVNSGFKPERGRGGRREPREPREIRENDGDKRPPRRQGPREFRDNRGGDENVPPEFRERPEGGSGGGFNRNEVGERGRGRGRGRGGFRGNRGGRGGFRGGDTERTERQGFGIPPGERKRDFDRHSGSDKTGIKAVEKKEGGGARNWGSYKDDIAEPAQENEERPQTEENPENFELNESGEGEAPAEADDQPKQMTLDEWKELQKSERRKPSFKIRKAGEGEEGSQWNKGTAYKKANEADHEHDEEEDDDDEDDEEKRHANKHRLDIKIMFNDPVRRGRGGRRPRDGRGRGRGSGRGERKPRDSAPRMDDENDFPRLVKTEA